MLKVRRETRQHQIDNITTDHFLVSFKNQSGIRCLSKMREYVRDVFLDEIIGPIYHDVIFIITFSETK